MYIGPNLLGSSLGALHGRRGDELISSIVIVLLLELHLFVLDVVLLGSRVLGVLALAGSGSGLLARGGGGRAGAGSLDGSEGVGVAGLTKLLDVLAVDMLAWCRREVCLATRETADEGGGT